MLTLSEENTRKTRVQESKKELKLRGPIEAIVCCGGSLKLRTSDCASLYHSASLVVSAQFSYIPDAI